MTTENDKFMLKSKRILRILPEVVEAAFQLAKLSELNIMRIDAPILILETLARMMDAEFKVTVINGVYPHKQELIATLQNVLPYDYFYLWGFLATLNELYRINDKVAQQGREDCQLIYEYLVEKHIIL